MPRRVLEGKVVSDVNHKTVTVRVERRFMHPVYKKYVKKSSKYTAHDENNMYKTGDNISIIECSPLSKTKRWVVMIDGQPGPTASVAVAAEKVAVAKKAEAKTEAKKVAAAKPKAKKAPAKKAADKKPAAKKAAAKKDDKK